MECVNKCVRKYHLCNDCIFSMINGRTDVTKASGMCKLARNQIELLYDGLISKEECLKMLSELPEKEREKYYKVVE